MRLAITFSRACVLVAGLVQGSPASHSGVATIWGGLIARVSPPGAGPGDRVPGTSTMWHCKGTGSNDIATLDFVDMSPKVLSKYAIT